MQELKWTGERMMPYKHLGLGAAEHLHRYVVALEITAGKIVLDISCGEGYGSNLIASKAEKVYGIDIAEEVIEHAKRKYTNNKITFLKGSVTNIPIQDGMVDIIVCFETIEHIIEQDEMMKELKRVLKNEGMLLISTPAKENYESLNHNNPFHLKELSSDELKTLCKKYFKEVSMYKQRYIEASFVYQEEAGVKEILEYEGSFESILKKDFIEKYYYNIVVCSDFSIPMLGTSFFNAQQFNYSYSQDVTRRVKSKIQNSYQNSYSFKIGRFIVHPFSFIKSFFK